jgi:hypothetical protein
MADEDLEIQKCYPGKRMVKIPEGILVNARIADAFIPV